MIIRLPSRLLACPVAWVEARISEIPPQHPSNTPKAFIFVIGSFRIMAASNMTKIGTPVAIMDASTGEVRFSPTINNPWLIPTPQRAHIKSKPRSFIVTFSRFIKSEVSQNNRQAELIRMIVSASGCTWEGNRYLEMGILMANNMFAIRINI